MGISWCSVVLIFCSVECCGIATEYASVVEMQISVIVRSKRDLFVPDAEFAFAGSSEGSSCFCCEYSYRLSETYLSSFIKTRSILGV